MKPESSATAEENDTDSDAVDVEGSLVEMENEQHQYEGVRRQIRQDLRNIQQDASRNRVGLVSGSAERLQSALNDVDRIFRDVRHCREAVIDAQVMSAIAQMGKEKVQTFATGLSRMNSIQFVEKLVTFISRNAIRTAGEPFQISRKGWLELGKGCCQYFKHSPSLHFMFGSFSRDPPELKQKRERKPFPKDTDNLKASVAPKQVTSLQEMEKKESTTVEVERIYKILKQLYSRENSPICYFEFVTNPDSFSQTVENMFHTSFLVRDGLCRIELDSDRLPTIAPVELRDKNQAVSDLPNHQVVIPMTQEEWKNVVQTFEIKKPLIPTRTRSKNFEGGKNQPSSSGKSQSQTSDARKLNALETRPLTQSNNTSGRRRPATGDVETDSD